MSFLSEALLDSPRWGYALDDPSGTNAPDLTTNNNAGTYVNSPTLAEPGLLNREPSKSTKFVSASSQYMWVADNNSADMGDTFTLEAWIKLSSLGSGTDRTIISKQNGAYALRVNSSDQLELLRSQTAALPHAINPFTSLGPHHVMATKSGATVALYVNGADAVPTGGGASTCADNTNRLLIGADGSSNTPGQYTNGWLQFAFGYATALSATRALAHFETGYQGIAPFTYRTAAATSVTIPPHRVGDIIVIVTEEASTAPAISTPAASGTVPAWSAIQQISTDTDVLQAFYFIATAANHTSGTWTNSANTTAIVIGRGNGTLGIGASAQATQGVTGTLIRYPAITRNVTDGSSAILRIGHRRTANAAVGTVPTANYSLVVSIPNATETTAVFQYLNASANPSQDDVTGFATTATKAITAEITFTPTAAPLIPTLVSPSIAAQRAASW